MEVDRGRVCVRFGIFSTEPRENVSVFCRVYVGLGTKSTGGRNASFVVLFRILRLW